VHRARREGRRAHRACALRRLLHRLGAAAGVGKRHTCQRGQRTPASRTSNRGRPGPGLSPGLKKTSSARTKRRIDSAGIPEFVCLQALYGDGRTAIEPWTFCVLVRRHRRQKKSLLRRGDALYFAQVSPRFDGVPPIVPRSSCTTAGRPRASDASQVADARTASSGAALVGPPAAKFGAMGSNIEATEPH
jgi:hypothetical protein